MMSGKAVLVTGGNGGLGAALCRSFKAAGFCVIATDRSQGRSPDSDHFVPIDLDELVLSASARESFRQRVLAGAEQQGAKLFALVNNAASQVTGSIDSISIDQFEASQRTNVAVPFLLSKLLAPELRASHGTIVNIGSVHARLTKPGFCAYSVSKAGLTALSRALAIDFAGEVTVNTISPGALDTPMLRAGFERAEEKLAALASHHPVGRIGQPDEVAHLAVFLASEKARFISGAELRADGGVGARLHDPA